jgi:hypothetical protein
MHICFTQGVSKIQRSLKKPDPSNFMPDILVWTEAMRGQYTVKSGYDVFWRQGRNQNLTIDTKYWSEI